MTEEILKKYTKNIHYTWGRIRDEILTPVIKMYDNYKMNEIKELHPKEPYCKRRKLLRIYN